MRRPKTDRHGFELEVVKPPPVSEEPEETYEPTIIETYDVDTKTHPIGCWIIMTITIAIGLTMIMTTLLR